MGNPLVSCIMPSKRGPEYVKRALACFQAQTYQQRELIMVFSYEDHARYLNWSMEQTKAWDPDLPSLAAELLAPFKGTREVSVPPGLSIGELRNIAIREARGSIIAHWDDDDWSAPDRLERQVRILTTPLAGELPDITGSTQICFADERSRQAWHYDGLAHDWVAGGTFCYWRHKWEGAAFNPFITYGEDTCWCVVGEAFDEKVDYVATLNDDNTSPKAPGSQGWTTIEWDELPEGYREQCKSVLD